jgi:hypothetical protein
MTELSRKIGRFVCSLGWHPRPFEMEPRPAGVTLAAYRASIPRHACRRCGAVGRLDAYGNLDPDRAGGAAKVAW